MEREEILKKVLDALKRSEQKIHDLEKKHHEPIAIVGASCRLPGNINGLESYAQSLFDGIDAIQLIPQERWNVESFFDPQQRTPGKMYVREGGFLRDIDLFEPSFFNISPREAVTLDPQQRLLLELVWEALEQGGIAPLSLRNSLTSVYIGIYHYDYLSLIRNSYQNFDNYNVTGNVLSTAAGRISYTLGLEGPCMSIDTACSSSLVAIHQACMSLRQGDSNLAIAGGVNLILTPDRSIDFCQANMLSPSNRCKTFDAEADGFIRSEGCGIVILKRLSDALKDNDTILAVIRGSAINQNGPRAGLTVPNTLSQKAVILSALQDAQLPPGDIDYVELHGAATTLGDPIEIESLEVLNSKRTVPVLIGAVKSNIGHTESAAGIASLLKVVLSLQKEMIPKNINFKHLNPHIDLQKPNAQILTENTPWKKGGKIRRAGVTSLGISGTNAHVIVEEAPIAHLDHFEQEVDRPLHLVTLSAMTPTSLQLLIDLYQKDLPDETLADIAYTANVGRSHFPNRIAIVAKTKQELVERLKTGNYTKSNVSILPEIIFLYTANNGENSELSATSPFIKNFLEHNEGRYEDSVFELWKSWGIVPDQIVKDKKGFAAAEGSLVITAQNSWADILELLKELYLKGFTIDWKTFDHPYKRKKVSLPTYPFARSRYWVEQLKSEELDTQNLKNDTLLGSQLQTVSDEKLFTSKININFFSFLKDHVVFESKLLPGAGFIEIFREAGTVIFDRSAVTISQLFIDQPLALDSEKSTQMQVLAKQNENVYETSVYSLRNEKWNLHAKCILSSREELSLQKMDWEHWRSICTKPVESTDLYKRMDAIGFHYGPRFQTVQKVWIAPDELIAELEGDSFPAILDGVFHSMYALLGRNQSYLPFSVDEMTFYSEPVSEIRIHAKLRFSSEIDLTADFEVFGLDGSQLLSIKGFHARRINQSLLRQMLEKYETNDVSSWVYQTCWLEKPLTKKEKNAQDFWWLVSPSKLELKDLKTEWINPHETKAKMLSDPPEAILWFIESENSLKTLLEFIQVMKTTQTKPKICFVTHGIQPIGSIENLEAAFFNGFFKTLHLEMPDLDCKHIDLGKRENFPVDEIDAEDEENQVAYRNNIRYIPRLIPEQSAIRSGGELLIPSGQRYHLTTSPGNSFEHFTLKSEGDHLVPSFGEIAIEIKAAGLNFRDVLAAMGYKVGVPGPLGAECAGIVSAVGPDVTQFKVGDEVVGFASDCFASHAIGKTDLFLLIPDSLDLKSAAGIPIVFTTAHEALHQLAQVKPGDKVLIHAAAGGLGLAAIQIAQQAKAEIYATASTHEKHAYLNSIGIDHVYHSRNLKYADEILKDTGGQGVDIVINSLSGEGFIEATLRACSQGARFVEVGKRNIFSMKDMEKYRPDIHYFILALDEMLVNQQAKVRSLLERVLKGFAEGRYKPLPTAYFSITEADKAFTFLQKAKNIGKVIITMPSRNKLKIDPKASYLVTGGFGALGGKIADWLVKQGAKHIVLAGRTIPPNMRLRAEFVPAKLDVSIKSEIDDLIQKFGSEWPEIKGIFHCAGLIDDSLLQSQHLERFERAMAPKILGSQNLHRATNGKKLDIFVLFSSIASTLGSPGQLNYASANSYLDALAFLRSKMGLPALSISWGPWAEIGLAANLVERHRSNGMLAFKTAEGMEAFDYALAQPQPHVTIAKMDWKLYSFSTPFLNELIKPKKMETKLLLKRLQEALDSERKEIISEYLQKVIGKILNVPALDPEAGFFQLGMDSLMSEELYDKLQTEIGEIHHFPTTIAFDYPSINKLMAYFEREVFPLMEKSKFADSEVVKKTDLVSKEEEIAIIGIGCRFPGGADNPSKFWNLLKAGYNGISEIPPDRWDVEAFYSPDPEEPGKMYVKKGGFLKNGVDQFDASFFSISRREAEYMDPQQRLLLEIVWEALENAGIDPLSLKGTQTGVYVGNCSRDYFSLLEKGEENINAYLGTGNAGSLLAGRISYFYGLQGPSISIDTACSSSLVAVNMACKSLQSGECRLAIAGGVNIILNKNWTINFCKAKMLAKDGFCKTFDAEADGYVRSEGCGVAILKRLSEAIEDNDPILGIIKGSAVNQDGTSSGLTVPNGESQIAVIRQSLKTAGLGLEAIDYVEAHGTGTSLGDPIEVGALNSVFKERQNQPLRIGTVKTNIGHLEGAAGIAGFIKTVLALVNEAIPPHLHFKTINPRIDLEAIPLEIPLSLTPWPRSDRPRIAGVSSFGFSGTNVHMLIQEPPVLSIEKNVKERPLHIITFSAKTEPALEQLITLYSKHLPEEKLEDIAYTANTGRSAFSHRAAVVANSREDLLSKLHEGEYLISTVPRKLPKIAFYFTGSTFDCTELLDTSPVFKESFERSGGLHEYALYELWKSWGIIPDSVAGSGIGDIIASVVAGIMSLEDGLQLINLKDNPEKQLEFARSIPVQEPTMIFISSWSGKEIRKEKLEPGYWIPHETASFPFSDYLVIEGKGDWKGVLQTLSKLYVSGISIDWKGFDRPFHRKKVALPNYPFQRERYWVDSINLKPGSYLPKRIHPLLGEFIYTPSDDKIFRNEINLLELKFLKDHQIFDKVVFPGAAYMDMLMAACQEIFKTSTYEINSLSFEQPLVFENKNNTSIELFCKAYQNNYEASIYTFADGAETLHAKGVISLLGNGKNKTLNWDSLTTRCPEKMVIADFYKALKQRGIHLGSYFQTISKLWKGVNELAAEIKAENFPTLLDGALQSISILLEDDNHLFLPIGIDHLLSYSELKKEIRIHGVLQRETETDFVADLTLFSFDGKVIMEIQGFHARKTDKPHFENILTKKGKETAWLYQVEWMQKPLGISMEIPNHTWLVVSDEAYPISDLITKSIKPLDIPNVDINKFNGIIWLVTGAYRFQDILKFVQSISSLSIKPPLFFVTKGVQPIGQLLDLESSGFNGFFKTLRLEMPDLPCRHIDLSPSASFPIAELFATDKEDQVAYRDSLRYVPRLRNDNKDYKSDYSNLDSASSYLITGGFGGIGSYVIDWMAKKGAKHLVIAGRNPHEFTPISGVTIETVQLDVASKDSVENVMQNFGKIWPPLKGIIHAAGIIQDASINEQNEASFDRVFEAKVSGSWNLHTASLKHQLDFFILFSSIASVLGSPGQINYATANSYEEALAFYRQQMGLKALAISWGPWSNRGMAANLSDKFRAKGFIPFNPEQGISCFERAMHSSSPHLIAVNAEWRKLVDRQQLTLELGSERNLEASALIERLQIADPIDRIDIIFDYLQSIVCNILRATSINPEQGFFDAGMDSLMAVELRNKLQTDLGNLHTLPSTLAFDFPSIESLAKYYEGNVFPLINQRKVVKTKSSVIENPIETDQDIAIIGMSCRYPKGANSPDEFWNLLKQGYDGITEVPATRWNIEEYYDPDFNAQGKTYCRYGGFLDIDIKGFDAPFFGISPREAEYMDPQQRLILEVAWESLENACINPLSLKGTSTGVFLGVCFHDYFDLIGKSQSPINVYFTGGNAASVIAGRLSYFLGLQGPSQVLDTACSSSLVALHLACMSLQTGECNLAITGGVNILLNPDITVAFSSARMLAKDGHCKTFDASADGYVRSEGCGILVLKRYQDAVRDQDNILAVIKSSQTNQDGASSGLTVPNGEAQAALIKKALENAHLKPDAIDYIEAHGTGTPLGDPIEIGALKNVFKGRSDKPLFVGTIKTNIGHTEAAAGVAGIIKTVLALKNEEIPPHINFHQLNPHIPLMDIPAQILTRLTAWPRSEKPRIAGVNSFGFSGSNAHVIIQEAPLKIKNINLTDRPLHVLTLSAKSEEALNQLISRYIKEMPDSDLADIAYTANTGRAQFIYRIALLASTKEECREKLSKGEFFKGQALPRPPKVAFIFNEIDRDIKELEDTSSVFKEAFRKGGVFEYAFLELWKSWGIIPDYVFSSHEKIDVAGYLHHTTRWLEPSAIPAETIVIQANNTWKQILTDLCQLFLKGKLVDWVGFDKPYDRQKVKLPNYPFQRQQYWIESISRSLEFSKHEGADPLLGYRIDSAAKEHQFKNTIDPNVLSYLNDHFIFDAQLFPGAGFVEMIRAAAKQLLGEDSVFSINNFKLEQPLALSKNKGTEIELIASPSDRGYEVMIYSLENKSWTSHVKSSFLLNEIKEPINYDATQLDNSCPNEVDVSHLYRLFDSVGLHYGKLFQTIQKIRTGENELVAELYSEATPALLDGAVQSLAALIRNPKSGYLPYSMEKISCYHELEPSIRVHAKLKQFSEMDLKADLHLYSMDGRPLMSIEGFYARRIDKVKLKQMLNREKSFESLLYNICWVEKPLENSQDSENGSLLIVSENNENRNQLPIKLIHPEFAIDEVESNKPSGVVWYSTYETLGFLLNYVHYLQKLKVKPKLYLITNGIVNLGPLNRIFDTIYNGFYQTLRLEMPDLDCRHIDLAKDEVLPANEIFSQDNEGQVAYWNNTRFVARLNSAEKAMRSGRKLIIPLSQKFQLDISAKGSFENLYLKDLVVDATLGPKDILVEVEAAGLNFRDVLDAMGFQLGQEGPLGAECAGVVRQIGSDVVGIRIGDSVVGFAPGCFSSHVAAPAELFEVMPQNLNFCEAATIPIAFSTAYEALINLAKLQSGEKVLVHAGAGGVGLAAIQLAQKLGVEIFATAGSQEKQDYLRSLGVEHIYHSRSTGFADAILKDTNGRGIDVVINSLSGEGFIESTLKACAAHARFVEIGKRNIWSKEEMHDKRPDMKYFVLALDDLLVNDSKKISHLLKGILSLFRKGQLKPLPQTSFQMEEAISAFEYLQRAKNIGRVILKLPKSRNLTIDASGSYLVTGGMGSLGLEVAKWLAMKGARHLVLVSRHVTKAIEIEGATIETFAADISQKEDVENLIDKFGSEWPELKGIIHGAGVLDDAILSDQTMESFNTVFSAKIKGSWNLHTSTTFKSLDFFVLFSSIASVFGSPSQLNYSSANSFLDALACFRQNLGLPGLSIAWGPWAEIGLAAKLAERNRSRGIISFTVQTALKMLEIAMNQPQPLLIAASMDWGLFPYHSSFFEEVKNVKGKAYPALLQNLESSIPSERKERLTVYLQKTVGKILGLNTLNLDQGFFEAGMDSLMTEELQEKLQRDLGHSYQLPATLAFDFPTINKLVHYFEENIFTTIASPQQKDVQPPSVPLTSQETDLIAVVGLGCRFPGGANNPEEFWRLLHEGFDGISVVPPERWNIDSYYDPNPDTPGKMYVRKGGFLDNDIRNFDADFFAITPREAEFMDPQQRLLLEVSWEALEDANINPLALKGTSGGVFIGTCSRDYFDMINKDQTLEGTSAYLGTGNAGSVLSGRLSYFLGLQGPSLAIDTACSSSLVALSSACKSLRIGECDLALAGGVNIILNPAITSNFCKAHMLASDGYCKTFDASADGYVRGEGCGIIVLKRLKDAMKNQDTILGLIRSDEINQDGASSGLTVPNGEAQTALMRKALEKAKLGPESISYIEAHGTGTPLGDPIEISALSSLFAGRKKPLIIGTVKTNIGHLEGAAGIAGVIKTILSLNHEEIPPHLHFHQLNPRISLDAIPASLPLKPIPWPRSEVARLAGVSSFGFSGTNAHLILEEPPPKLLKRNDKDRPYHLLTISAKSPQALEALTEAYLKIPKADIGDIAYTSNTGRAHLNYRASIIAESTDQLLEKLKTRDFLLDKSPGKKLLLWFDGKTEKSEFLEIFPLYKKTVDAYPALPELAFANLLKSLGIVPDYVAGKGLGEVSAAIVAGLIDDRDGSLLASVYFSEDTRAKVAENITYRKPELNFISSWTGDVVRNEGLIAEYWKSHAQAIQVDSSDLIVINQKANSLGDVLVIKVPDTWSQLLELLGKIYINGAAINWKAWDQPFRRNKVKLPTYPFQRRRYWIDPARRTQGKETEGHPLLGEMILFPSQDKLFRNVIDLENLPYLKDHRILDQIVFPGAGFVEVLMTAAFHLFPQKTVILNNLSFEKPLIFDTSKATPIEVLAKPLEESFDAAVYSLDNQKWIVHAKAEILGSESQNKIEFDLEKARQNCPSLLDTEEFYNRLSRYGIQLGKPFQTIQKLWAGDKFVSAEIKGDEPSEIIDGCLQSVSALIKEGQDLYLPSSIDQVIIYDVLGKSVNAFGELINVSDHDFTANIFIFSVDGNLLMKLEGFRARKTDRFHFERMLLQSDKLSSLFYFVDWIEKGLNISQEQKHPWLVVSEQDIQLNDLQYSLVKPSEVNAVFNQNHDYVLWIAREKESLKNALNFVKTINSTNKALRLVFVTYGVQPVGQIVDLYNSVFTGFYRTLLLEMPELELIHIDLDEKEPFPVQELFANDGEKEVAYRNSVRYVAKLKRADWMADLPRKGIQIDPQASYLIVGGMGGLGRKTSEWLAHRGAKHLVIVGRSIHRDFVIPGVTVEKVALDVSHKSEVQNLINQFGKLWPPLKGILQASGVLEDATLSSQDWNKFETTFTAKVMGSWNLHEASKEIPLDFFVLFSSIASIFGSPGQINYASANAYLDALAYYRKARKLPALSISWGPWSEVGMAAKLIERNQARGFVSLSPKIAIECLEKAINQDSPHLVIAAVNWNELHTNRNFFSFFIQDKPTNSSLIIKLNEAHPSEQKEILTEFIQKTVSKIIGVESLNPDAGFFDIGMDSLMAVELRNQLQENVGDKFKIPNTLVFDYPSINQVSAFLYKGLINSKNIFKNDIIEDSISATISQVTDIQKEVMEMDLDQISKFLKEP